jgi:hypothetical protein
MKGYVSPDEPDAFGRREEPPGDREDLAARLAEEILSRIRRERAIEAERGGTP